MIPKTHHMIYIDANEQQTWFLLYVMLIFLCVKSIGLLSLFLSVRCSPIKPNTFHNRINQATTNQLKYIKYPREGRWIDTYPTKADHLDLQAAHQPPENIRLWKRQQQIRSIFRQSMVGVGKDISMKAKIKWNQENHQISHRNKVVIKCTCHTSKHTLTKSFIKWLMPKRQVISLVKNEIKGK